MPPPVPFAETGTLPRGGADPLAKREVEARLSEARSRTRLLVENVCEQDMDRVHTPLMSPLAWDLGHIAAFEDLWASCRTAGLEPLRPELMDVYDAAESPRAGRGDLPFLRCNEALAYQDQVRERTLAVLEREDGAEFVWELLIQHEHQHNETMLQTLKLAEPGVYSPTRRQLPDGGQGGGGAVRVEGGSFPLGDSGERFAYDNERPRHDAETDAFEVDRTPVSNGAYREFVEDGGYGRPELWSERGWEWREREGIERPLYWTEDGGERSFDRVEELDPELPVMHVSFHEAEAFACWRGGRLPTEADWEKAAAWDAAVARKHYFPWGEEPATEERANLDQLAFGPAPCGAYPDGASPCGALGMLGDCWEWTASDFVGYPGFRAFPYREYSEVFFGSDYKVLRGGAWATRPSIARATFRNWDYPERRQIFVGFRCVRDA